MNAPDAAAPSGEPDLTALRSSADLSATLTSWTPVSGFCAEQASGRPQIHSDGVLSPTPLGLPKGYLSAEAELADRSPFQNPDGPELPDVSDDDEEDIDELVEAATGGEVSSLGRHARLLLQRSTAEAVRDRFPGLQDPAHARFLVHTLVGRNLHTSVDGSGRSHTRVVISFHTLDNLGLLRPGPARGFGRELYSKLSPRSDVAWPFLQVHQTILTAFRWTSWRKGEWSRQVEDAGLPADVRALFLADLAVPVSEAGLLVDFAGQCDVPDPRSGHPFEAASAALQLRHSKAIRQAARSPWSVQRRLLRLLNSAPANTLSRLVRANAAAAIAVALKIEDADRQLRVLAALREIQLSPALVYVPSKRGRTPRVFTDGVSVLGLPRDVRKALFGGCVELDLTNAQLACAASLWSIEPLLDHLRREGPIWPHLLAVVAGMHALEDDEAKAALKRAVFSVTFGMSRQGVRRRLVHDLSADSASAFLSDALVESLFAARNRALREIDAAERGTDCFGVRYQLTEPPGSRERRAECRSILACTMQAMELRLLEPVIAEAERMANHTRPNFRIVGWLHDGFSITARKESAVRRLVRLVNEHANRLGVPSQLASTRLSAASPPCPVLNGQSESAPTVTTGEAAFGGLVSRGEDDSRIARLLSLKQNSLPGGPDGRCWIWQGSKDRDGYGRVRQRGRLVRAHRLAWELHEGGPVPLGLVVRHQCHTPGCVKPSHLIVGTQAENIADRDAAGRTARGEQNGRSALTDDVVREARRLAEGGEQFSRIARRFGVDPSTARAAIRGRTWTHIKEDPVL